MTSPAFHWSPSRTSSSVMDRFLTLVSAAQCRRCSRRRRGRTRLMRISCAITSRILTTKVLTPNGWSYSLPITWNRRRSTQSMTIGGVGEFRRLSPGNRFYRDQDIIQKAGEDFQVGCDGINDGGVRTDVASVQELSVCRASYFITS